MNEKKCKGNFAGWVCFSDIFLQLSRVCTVTEGGNAELKNKVFGAVTEILGSSQPRAPGGLLQTFLPIHNVKLRRASALNKMSIK